MESGVHEGSIKLCISNYSMNIAMKKYCFSMHVKPARVQSDYETQFIAAKWWDTFVWNINLRYETEWENQSNRILIKSKQKYIVLLLFLYKQIKGKNATIMILGCLYNRDTCDAAANRKFAFSNSHLTNTRRRNVTRSFIFQRDYKIRQETSSWSP